MKVVATEKLPIKMWLEDIEDGALAQAKNLANLPFIFKHIALMPDAHQGYGMPIGGVMATRGVIVPNAVGVDIGCGMCAVDLGELELPTETLKKIMGEIRQKIPVGFKKHSKNQVTMPSGHQDLPIVHREFSNAQKSLGTLGGGNHFIEIQKDQDNHIWVMIHSGSRNLGKQVADHYNKIAIELNERYFSQVPKEYQLAFLPMDTQQGQDYLAEMQYCVDFALASRESMIAEVVNIIGGMLETGWAYSVINIAHNYAAMENHYGQNVMVHRKGATKAYEGQLGIIPGSQGSSSYIVKGKGNQESFKSCSHGAGRRMGRKQAQRELNLEDETRRLNDLGVIHSVRGVKDLDEAPGAYKSIETVMDNQTDLVSIEFELTPLAVIKG